MSLNKKAFKFIDLFAGVGGFHIALHDLGGKCVFASEIDKFARATYEKNFKKLSPELFENGNFNDDITKVDYKSMPDFDVLCAGFPCQAFSIAGYREGFNDSKGRGNLFFNIIDILKAKHPKLFILENVKNLKGHDNGRTYHKICHEITKLGYGFKSKIVNSSSFGLHHNRERIFLIGKMGAWSGDAILEPNREFVYEGTVLDQLLNSATRNKLFDYHIPDHNGKEIVKMYNHNEQLIHHKISISGQPVIFFDPPILLQKYLYKHSERNDWDKFIYNFKGGHHLKIVESINHEINKKNSFNLFNHTTSDSLLDNGYQFFYQWRRKYIRVNKSGFAPTLTANMGIGGHNVPLIVCGQTKDKCLVRKLTPEECIALQGFKRYHFEGITNVSQSNFYKQAGNSVPVPVVREIAKTMINLI